MDVRERSSKVAAKSRTSFDVSSRARRFDGGIKFDPAAARVPVEGNLVAR